MSHHDYREEPNVRFSPDKTMVFFTSNLFGASYLVTRRALLPDCAHDNSHRDFHVVID